MSGAPNGATTEYDFRTIPASDAYKLMIGTIVPRPIAWVSTINAEGKTNLAPFSFFNGVCSNPPTLMFSITRQPDGSTKDTLNNIRATKSFVVNVASERLAKLVNATAETFPPEVSEFEAVGIKTAPSKVVSAPRVKDSPVSMECELDRIVEIGDGKVGSACVVFGRIVYFHASEKVCKDGKIAIEELKPLARLAGFSYCPVREVFEIRRPK